MVYTLVPLPLYMAVSLCVLYSFLCELLYATLSPLAPPGGLVVVRALMHLATHIIAAHIMIMTEVRMRGECIEVSGNNLTWY